MSLFQISAIVLQPRPGRKGRGCCHNGSGLGAAGVSRRAKGGESSEGVGPDEKVPEVLGLVTKGPGLQPVETEEDVTETNGMQRSDDRWREEHQWWLYEHQCVAHHRRLFKGATVWHWSLAQSSSFRSSTMPRVLDAAMFPLAGGGPFLLVVFLLFVLQS